ncbi:MAG: hypothetical protein R3Y32_00290 [Bacillota bacterium]
MNKTKLIIIGITILVIAAAIFIPMATSNTEADICHDECCEDIYVNQTDIYVNDLSVESNRVLCEACGDDGICDEKQVICFDCECAFGYCEEGAMCETCSNTGYVVLYGPFRCHDCDVADRFE